MSSRISLLVGLLPPHSLAREIHFQYSLNPARCQRTTVSGCTRINAFRQPDQMRRSMIQRNRSLFENLAGGRRRAKTASCWRNARFSKRRSRRDRRERTDVPNMSLRTDSMATLYHRKHNRIGRDSVLTRYRSRAGAFIGRQREHSLRWRRNTIPRYAAGGTTSGHSIVRRCSSSWNTSI